MPSYMGGGENRHGHVLLPGLRPLLRRTAYDGPYVRQREDHVLPQRERLGSRRRSHRFASGTVGLHVPRLEDQVSSSRCKCMYLTSKLHTSGLALWATLHRERCCGYCRTVKRSGRVLSPNGTRRSLTQALSPIPPCAARVANGTIAMAPSSMRRRNGGCSIGIYA